MLSLAGSLRKFWLFKKVRPYTTLEVSRLDALYSFILEANSSLEGDIVECGTWKGGSAAVMAYVLSKSRVKRNVWLFDSFEGLPAPSEIDGQKARKKYYPGLLKTPSTNIQDIFKKLKISSDNVKIIEGWFSETFPKVKIEKIAILHIDADFYEPVKMSLEKFYPSVVPGGIVVLDDFGTWEGCRAAFEEFRKKQNKKIDLIQIDKTAYYFRKLE
ncbi:class I SAM-dependent methyltransferase [Candidatus Giovannonibacteria bacterium]|nr:class I SAM-dependent methyltransferase [Candidatus Giovannonibacteria bacterium]